MTNPKSMDEMKAAARGTGGMECPKCGCRHLISNGAKGQRGKTYRYRLCRNCGASVFTREEILREVVAEPDAENIPDAGNSLQIYQHKAG